MGAYPPLPPPLRSASSRPGPRLHGRSARMSHLPRSLCGGERHRAFATAREGRGSRTDDRGGAPNHAGVTGRGG